MQEYVTISHASNASLDEVRAVWETNVFGVLAVYQAMLPLLRASSDAPVYPASKTALNAITLAMMIELESTGINNAAQAVLEPLRTR
jgi:NAD(P)-dependent dehydrogenase (short-subunit alcohol dehydrogenase family)